VRVTVLARPVPRTAEQSGRLLVLLGALTGLTPMAVDMYLPALPSLTRDLHTTSAATQLTLAALLVGLAAGQLIIGPMSDRLGRRGPVMAGLAGFVLASIGCAFAPNIVVLVGLRLLQGLSGAAAVVVARAVVRDLYEGVAAARAFATLTLVMGAAPVLAPVIGAQVLRGTSWRGLFALLATAGLVLLFATWQKLPETLPPERRNAGGFAATMSIFGLLLRDRGFLLPALAGGAGFAGMFAYIGSSSYVLQELHGLSPQEYSGVFAVNSATLILLSQIGGWLVRRTGSAWLLLAGATINATGASILVAGALLDIGLPAVLLGLLLVAGSVGLIVPNAIALALNDHARHAGAASALVGLLQFVLGAIAAPLGGVGGSRSDEPMALTIAGASAIGLTCAALTARRHVMTSERIPDLQAL
jgi:DHA1 family bicyclomycin/chloramphenicol resistance-like MFS transporter